VPHQRWKKHGIAPAKEALILSGLVG